MIRVRSPLQCFDDPLPPLSFCEETFCFTGVFALGSREAVINQAQMRGGSHVPHPVQKGCIVVVGCVANDAWMYTTHGTKIEIAMHYRDRGLPVRIVPEEHFVNELLRFDAEGNIPSITPLKVKKVDTNILVGLAKGMVSDGKIQQEEAEFLLHWLESNKSLQATFPITFLLPRIQEFLKDGVLDSKESEELFDILKVLSSNLH